MSVISPLSRYIDLLLKKNLYEEAFGCATDAVGRYGYQQGLVLFERLLACLPENQAVRYNVALMLEKTGQTAKAFQQYRLLFRQVPEYGRAAIGYARLLVQQNQYVLAVNALRQAVAASPDDPEVAAALGNSLVMAGEAEAALLWYGIAFASGWADRRTLSNFLYTALMVSEVSPATIAYESDQISKFPPLLFRLTREARRLSALSEQKITGLHQQLASRLGIEEMPSVTDSGNHGRVRVGYFSSDWYTHPVGLFLEGVLANHARQQWEIFIFSPFAERDQLTAKLKALTEHWILLDDDNRQESLSLIRACHLDIAVDMSGHTGGNYLDLFAQRLAPVQITWGGYPATTGLPAMDYIIADPVSLPLSNTAYYSERPLRLPNDYICLLPPEGMPLPGLLPAVHAGYVTFGSFNTIQKLNSNTIKLWGKVLRAVPDARLFLKTRGFDDPLVCASYMEKLKLEGIEPERVLLQGYSPRPDLLATYQQVDIALDPVPYQGGVTILEALWMGVPTLVLQGCRHSFIRHAESHLVNVGLQDWIAITEEEFVGKAVVWSRNLQGLSVLRCSLRDRMAASPICDAAGFTRDLEAAFELAWRERGTISRR